MDPTELAAWLRLLETPGVGRESVRRLLAAFGTPVGVLAASALALRQVVTPAVAAALAAPPAHLPALVDATLSWLNAGGIAGEPSRNVVTLGDACYPDTLLNTADPPLLLYLQGDAALLRQEALAIVGSRSPTPQGADNARQFACQLSQAGWVVVSGLALGIDGAAHEGALKGRALGGESSIAVVGTGLDCLYPKRHLGLARQMAQEGLLISEYALGTPPLPAHFPQRNRIIAGLTAGTLVVEAALKSGSLITARLAMEAGRDVFALPGSIHSPQARGCHALIRQGALLVESVQDILDELKPGSRPRDSGAAASLPPASHHPLLELLGHDPATLDALVARTGWPAGELGAQLLELELEGHVARLPGQLFQRLTKA